MAHSFPYPGYGTHQGAYHIYRFFVRLKLPLIVGARVPSPCRQDVGTSTWPHDLKANTVSDAGVEGESQRVENNRLSGGYPKQFQFFEHQRDLVYKWADLLCELPRNLLELWDDCVDPVIWLLLEKTSYNAECSSPFPSKTSSSSTVLLRRPFFNSIVLRSGPDSFGSVRVSSTNGCNSLSMRPRTTSATERIDRY